MLLIMIILAAPIITESLAGMVGPNGLATIITLDILKVGSVHGLFHQRQIRGYQYPCNLDNGIEQERQRQEHYKRYDPLDCFHSSPFSIIVSRQSARNCAKNVVYSHEEHVSASAKDYDKKTKFCEIGY
jgi:hypothetical protein